jgi:hypothetical protein
MKKTILTSLLALLMTFGYQPESSALEVATHEKLNAYIAQNQLDGFSLGNYLHDQLGFVSYEKETFNKLMVWQWLSDGGHYEDKPGGLTLPYTRSANHFHNPLLKLDKAGFSGIWDIPVLFPGMSSILWSQMPKGIQLIGGHYSWYDVRDYYLKALTAKDLVTRNTNFAETFRGLGQLMHLVQDMSVPEHARNDGHYEENRRGII